MKISLNELKKYVDIKVSTEELLDLIGTRLVEIEGTEDLSEKYKGIKVVKVAECEKIPETHLSLCQIFDGEKNVQVVCGAPNVHAGMLAVWIMPGSIVPETFGNENFKLDVRKLRGYESNGMLAGADELALGDDHTGIVEVDPKMIGKNGEKVEPGMDFAEVFGLNDIILDIENKSLTHRPDCFGIIGFAREVAGILGEKFEEPEFLTKETVFPEGFLKIEGWKISSKNPVPVKIEDEKLCPRYTCAVLEFEDAPRSKYLTLDDIFLFKADMRPVSPIVDLTNILMLETGQPLHAFDYDKFVAVGGKEKPEISVRLAREDEELQLLDEKVVDLNENDILITSNDVPVALAGAMGGKNTEIDASTKKIILESATFSLYNLRKTQMAHGIFSEAITRFTKGQPVSNTFNILAEAVKRLSCTPLELTDEWISGPNANVVKITTFDINSLLGSNYSKELIVKTLENVGFFTESDGENLTITAPAYRTDIHIKEDIIEEVGRLLGYDNLPLDLPTRQFVGAEIDPIFALKTKIRNLLSDKLAANEILTYSFVSEDLQRKSGENPDDSYKIINSISPELQCFRQSLVPSILDKVRDNQKSGFSDFSLYEINQISKKSLDLTEGKTPVLENHLGLVALGDYYSVKNLLFRFVKMLNLGEISLEKVEEDRLFEPLHSAILKVDGEKLAIFGEIRQSVLKKMKLEAPISAFEMNLDVLLKLPENSEKSLKLSKFPSVSRDLTLKVEKNLEFSKVEREIVSVLEAENLIFSVSPVSIYRPENEEKTKNLSFHLSFSDPKKTLDSAEISAIMEKITKVLSDDFGAEIV